MKRTKLLGYLKNMENKNKKFSYTKTMKLLDVGLYVYSDMISKVELNEITNYNKSKYIIEEINNQFEEVQVLVNNNKLLMSICLLRNLFEEIMYIMATSLKGIDLDINPDTRAGYFKEIVEDNITNLLSDNFENGDMKEIYSHLSKLSHVTNLKEATSYLVGTKKYNKYIKNELKYLIIIIQFMFIDFINVKNKYSNISMCEKIFWISTYTELINSVYFVANAEKGAIFLKKYFYGEKNKKYLDKSISDLTKLFSDFKVDKREINKTIKQISKELDNELKLNNYFEITNKILNCKEV